MPSGGMRGKGNLSGKLRQLAKAMPDRVASALYAESNIETTEMKRRTPVDITEDAPHPGNLRNSIHVEPPIREGRKITVIIATGAQAPYAIYVHENPDAFHPIGEYKFMEKPLAESQPHMASRVAARLKVDE